MDAQYKRVKFLGKRRICWEHEGMNHEEGEEVRIYPLMVRIDPLKLLLRMDIELSMKV